MVAMAAWLEEVARMGCWEAMAGRMDCVEERARMGYLACGLLLPLSCKSGSQAGSHDVHRSLVPHQYPLSILLLIFHGL